MNCYCYYYFIIVVYIFFRNVRAIVVVVVVVVVAVVVVVCIFCKIWRWTENALKTGKYNISGQTGFSSKNFLPIILIQLKDF